MGAVGFFQRVLTHLEVDQVGCGMGSHGAFEDVGKESKVAQPKKFAGKKGNEIYCWFAQL